MRDIIRLYTILYVIRLLKDMLWFKNGYYQIRLKDDAWLCVFPFIFIYSSNIPTIIVAQSIIW